MSSALHWPAAVRIAGRVAGSYPLEGTYHEAHLAEQAPDLIARANALVEEEAGIPAVGLPNVHIVGRQEWAASNVASFSHLLEPAADVLLRRGSRLGRAVAGRLVAAEVGALLGVLSRRVLGQYELVLPTGDDDVADTVLLVGANVLWMERLYQFRPGEFRLWLALHECTHRLQFTGVPWMRDYFLGLVRELVATAQPEQGRFARMWVELREAAAEGEPLIGEAGLLGLFASPEQRELLDRVQALMSLLEGHGHVMMDRIGSRVLVSANRMSSVLRRRRKDPRTASFFRLTGLELKLRQYELGERFVLGVEREGGREAINAAWADPGNLPTLDEISEPSRWLARVA